MRLGIVCEHVLYVFHRRPVKALLSVHSHIHTQGREMGLRCFVKELCRTNINTLAAEYCNIFRTTTEAERKREKERRQKRDDDK